LEQYDLVHNFSDSEGLVDKVSQLIDEELPQSYYLEKRNELINNKIDVTAFMVWFVENYPSSFQIMKDDSGYQNRFRSSFKR